MRRRWKLLWVLIAVVVVARARWSGPMPALSRVTTADRVVAITFDDGPLPPYTDEILALLAAHRAAATFFVIGREAERYPDLIRRLVADHMELALHGMTHLNLRRVGAAFMVQDAVRERALLARLAPGAPVLLFRPPYGYRSPDLERRLSDQHLLLVLWDVDTRDWTRPSVATIVQRVKAQVKPGSIVLFHDGGGNRSETVAALRLLLPWFHREGYQLVTVSQLLSHAGT